MDNTLIKLFSEILKDSSYSGALWEQSAHVEIGEINAAFLRVEPKPTKVFHATDKETQKSILIALFD